MIAFLATVFTLSIECEIKNAENVKSKPNCGNDPEWSRKFEMLHIQKTAFASRGSPNDPLRRDDESLFGRFPAGVFSVSSSEECCYFGKLFQICDSTEIIVISQTTYFDFRCKYYLYTQKNEFGRP